MKKLWSFYPLSYQLMPGEFYVYLTSLYLWQNIWPPKKQYTGGIWWMLYCAFCHEGLINSCSPYPCMSPLIINTPQLEVTCGGRTVTLHTLEPTTCKRQFINFIFYFFAFPFFSAQVSWSHKHSLSLLFTSSHVTCLFAACVLSTCRYRNEKRQRSILAERGVYSTLPHECVAWMSKGS